MLFDEIFQVCQLRTYSKHAEVIERGIITKLENSLDPSEECKYFTDWRADRKVCDKRYFETRLSSSCE